MNQDLRPLTAEEHAVLEGSMNALVVFALIVCGIFVSIGIYIAILPGYPTWAKEFSVFGMIFIAFIIGAAISWDWIKIKRDKDSGNAEIIKGRVDHKRIGLKGVGNYLYVAGIIFDVEFANWRSINVGDDIVIVRAPASQIILNIKKSNPMQMQGQ